MSDRCFECGSEDLVCERCVVVHLREQLAAAERELERHRHGQTLEGDFVCPNDLARIEAEREQATLRSQLEGDTCIYASEALRLRAALAVREEALRSLMLDAGGIVGAFEHELRAAIGNTNVTCLKKCIDEAQAALSDSGSAWLEEVRGALTVAKMLGLEVQEWCEEDCDKENVLGQKLCEVCEDVLPSHSADCPGLTARHLAQKLAAVVGLLKGD